MAKRITNFSIKPYQLVIHEIILVCMAIDYLHLKNALEVHLIQVLSGLDEL